MAAAWSDDTVPDNLAGATVSMSVSFAAAARATDLTARATVVRRGRSLCFCEVTVVDAADAVVAFQGAKDRFIAGILPADPDGRLPSRSLQGDWSNGYDGGLQNRRLGFDSLVPRLIDAVIFDLDGVLLDSESAWLDAKRAVVDEWGGRWKEAASRAMLGMSAPEWSVYMREEMAIDRAPEEIDAEVVKRLLEVYRERLPLLPGAVEAVERLAARWSLGLASSSNLEVIVVVMEAGGFAQYFDTWVSSEEVGRGKPAPDVFLEAARRMEVDPEACAAIEDSHNGILSAHAAGMAVVALPNHEFPPGEEALAKAGRVLDSLDALTVETITGLSRTQPRG